jgi:hypothetical protein
VQGVGIEGAQVEVVNPERPSFEPKSEAWFAGLPLLLVDKKAFLVQAKITPHVRCD